MTRQWIGARPRHGCRNRYDRLWYRRKVPRPRFVRVWLAVPMWVIVLGCIGIAVAAAEHLSPQAAEAFLQALVGDWNGEAVRTPRGPLPYDIAFTQGPNDDVAGVANPGAALHYWTFFLEDGRLRLRFLTTFRGNTEPTWLTAERGTEGTVQFRAERPPYLTVQVTPKREAVEINVMLRGEAHVDIRLMKRDESHP